MFAKSPTVDGEALAIRIARSIDAEHAVGVLDQIVSERGVAPELVRMDNGPEMTANALRDWCRLGGTGRSFIEPGSPWQNPFVESFGSRVRDKVLSSHGAELHALGAKIEPGINKEDAAVARDLR